MGISSKEYKAAQKARNHAMTRAKTNIIEFAKTIDFFGNPTTVDSWVKDKFMRDEDKDK